MRIGNVVRVDNNWQQFPSRLKGEEPKKQDDSGSPAPFKEFLGKKIQDAELLAMSRGELIYIAP